MADKYVSEVLKGLTKYCERHPEAKGHVAIVIYDDRSGHLAFDEGEVIPFTGFGSLLGLMDILEDESDTEKLKVPDYYG